MTTSPSTSSVASGNGHADEDVTLDARGVTKIFGGGILRRKTTVAVDNVSLTIPRENPGIIAVAGESGSGKTTLARLLLGIIPPTSGTIHFNGMDVASLSRGERRDFRREVQPIMQDPFEVYNPFYKVDHVLMTPVTNFKLATNKREARDMVVEALDTVGLRHQETLGRFPHQLSGGQRQRIMVARALLLKPRIIVADEPVSMVDRAIRAVLRDALAAGGSSLRDYATASGEPGYFQHRFQVYGRDGEACAAGHAVRRIVQGGRSTFYCPRCQR